MWYCKKLVLENFISHKNTEYIFSNEQAILVTGLNSDDDGQQRNGTGKSSLIEGISVAVAGDSLRKVKAKELVRNGEKKCFVSLLLENTLTSQSLLIERTVYSNTKSSEVKVFVNNEQNKNLISVNDANSFIFELLGVTREDFFSYYVISKEKFIPFLTASDTKKKEIISRFSGADLIDKTDDLVKVDLSDIDREINSCELSKEKALSKIEVYREQIENIKSEDVEQNRKKAVEQLNSQKDKVNEQIENTISNINIKQGDIALLDKQIEQTALTNYSKELDRLQESKKELNNKIDSLRDDFKRVREGEFKNDIDVLENRKSSLQAKIRFRQDIKREGEDMVGDIEKFLAGEIECPKCKHHFVLNSDLSIEESQLMLKELAEVIDQSNIRIKEIDKETDHIHILRSNIEDKIREKEKNIVSSGENLKEKLNEVNKAFQDISSKQNKESQDLQQLHFKKDSLKKEIEAYLQQNEINIKQIQYLEDQTKQEQERIYENKSKEIETKIALLSKEINETESFIESKQKHRNEVEEWVYIFKSFKSHLANKSIQAIEGFANLYLHRMKSNISINIGGYKTLSNGKIKEEISTEVLRNGVSEGSYGKFSAGERGRIDVGVVASIQNLINLNSKSGGLNLLCIDEALDSIDSMGLESIVKALQGLSLTIMIVTQNQVLNVDQHTITIEKKNGVSEILNND